MASKSCCQCFLVFWSLIFFAFAGVIFAVAVAYAVDLLDDDTVHILLSSVARVSLAEAAVALSVGLSVLLAFAAILGVCSACLDNKLMLAYHLVLLAIVIAAQVTAGALAARFTSEVKSSESALRSTAYILMHEDDSQRDNTSLNYVTDDNITYAFDAIQMEYQCCGINSALDYIDSTYAKQHNNEVPETCCRLVSPIAYVVNPDNTTSYAAVNWTECQAEWTTLRQNTSLPLGGTKQLYTQGCFDPFLADVTQSSKSRAFVGLLFALLVIEVIGFFISLGYAIEPLCGRDRRV